MSKVLDYLEAKLMPLAAKAAQLCHEQHVCHGKARVQT